MYLLGATIRSSKTTLGMAGQVCNVTVTDQLLSVWHAVHSHDSNYLFHPTGQDLILSNSNKELKLVRNCHTTSGYMKML